MNRRRGLPSRVPCALQAGFDPFGDSRPFELSYRAGEKVSEYHQLTILVPNGTVALLTRLSAQLQQPRWRIVHEALIEFAKSRK